MSKSFFKQLLREDAPQGDITTRAVFGAAKKKATACFVTREAITVSGFAAVREFLRVNFPGLKIKIYRNDGSRARTGETLAKVTGDVTSILVAERVSLNLLQHLSGIATETARYVTLAQKFSRTTVKILDTRKTTPGLRIYEKQAVRDGGGVNHRQNLSDQYLIKDNHIDAAGDLKKAVAAVVKHRQRTKSRALIEVEVRSLSEFKTALALPVDIILLDNMRAFQIKECVALRGFGKSKKMPLLEVSGGVTLKNLKKYLALGVDRISVGALTHSVRAVDIALKIA